MVDRNADDEWRDIAERLRHEARQTRPAFSESLHARICRAVEQGEMAEPLRPAPLARFRRAGIAAAVATTLAVGVLFLVWQGNFTGGPVPKTGDIAGVGGQEKDIIVPKTRPNRGFSVIDRRDGQPCGRHRVVGRLVRDEPAMGLSRSRRPVGGTHAAGSTPRKHCVAAVRSPSATHASAQRKHGGSVDLYRKFPRWPRTAIAFTFTRDI
jgi:hypothetical protein